MFKELRKNFVFLNMTIISTMMIVAFSIVYFSMYQSTMMNLQTKMSSIPILPPRIIEMLPDESDGTFSRGVLPTDYRLSFNLTLNTNGQVTRIDSFVDMSLETYQKAGERAFRKKKEYGTMKLDGRNWMYYIRDSGRTSIIGQEERVDSLPGYTIVFLDITDSVASLNSLLLIFIIVGSLMLFIIYLISVIFARKAVNGIEEAWNKQKQFIADASHEFKTPIAVIEANTDALLLEEKKKNKKWVSYIKVETNRMNKLVTDLLYLAKTENMDTPFEIVPFNISEVLKTALLSMEAIIFEKKLELKENIEENLILKGDASRVEQIMIILIDNAIKYSNDSGIIDINLKKKNKTIEFTVENTGIGISKEEISKVFDRFYKADTARTGADNSYGLGLSIAKATVERMGGKIFVESIPDKTTKFTVILKIK